NKPYEAGIFIIAQNIHGVLAHVTEIFARHEVNITHLTMNTHVDGKAKIKLTVEVDNASQLYSLIENIRTVPSIYEVVRASEDNQE
ncbi:MAG: ACT domain-containing protein, partial [Desulfovibrio sp.]